MPLEKQNFSQKANSIIITLYRDYFVNEVRKKKILDEILILNDVKDEKTKKEKYSSDVLLKTNINNKTDKTALIKITEEKWYHKILNFVRKIIKK